MYWLLSTPPLESSYSKETFDETLPLFCHDDLSLSMFCTKAWGLQSTTEAFGGVVIDGQCLSCSLVLTMSDEESHIYLYD